MKRFFLIGVVFVPMLLLIVCCSEMKEVIEAPSSIVNSEGTLPMTKSAKESSDCTDILHYLQSDHIVMLINGVTYKDSVYVQTLTPKDMEDLGITDEEKAVSQNYLNELNQTDNPQKL